MEWYKMIEDTKDRVSNGSRLLKLREIFEQETDEENELTLNQLVEKLKMSFGPDDSIVQIGTKAVRRDIHTLRAQGFEIIENIGDKGKKLYSYQNRLFEAHELRMLIDAVASARFVSLTDTERLLEKLKRLTSVHMAKTLDIRFRISSSYKDENRETRFTIDRIQNAMAERKIIRFHYGQYNVEKKFIAKRNGEWYFVRPLELIWNQDNYYLIGFFLPEEKIKHYRVDRMRDVEITEQSYDYQFFDLNSYAKNVFNMYNGPDQLVTIRFSNHMATVVIDRFGIHVPIKKVDDHCFEITTEAKVSDGFVQWLLSCGKNARVISPEPLVKRMKEEIEQIYMNYAL
ncbi:helix-turn-helix transcriptional regulator [Hazenella coriacea]|uniref:helix-turn-helix transcriptional regulator n=1 Tax=Hazenella coriacea TaxID=1179467 RepID=UPI0014047EA0|nr:WYL domain-containing protein [Hazenella coriacea]